MWEIAGAVGVNGIRGEQIELRIPRMFRYISEHRLTILLIITAFLNSAIFLP